MLQVETYYLIIKSYSMREKSDSLTKFYEETAEKLGIEKTVVKEVIENYYISIKHAMEDFSHEKIVIPTINKFLQPLLTIIPLQLISYEIAKKRNCDIDKPKNLAKSVTVE